MSFLKDEECHSVAKSELVRLLPSAKGQFLEIGCGEGATLEYVKLLEHAGRFLFFSIMLLAKKRLRSERSER